MFSKIRHSNSNYHYVPNILNKEKGDEEFLHSAAFYSNLRRSADEDRKHQYEEAAVKLICFKPDVKKEGGSYIEYRGTFKYFREDTHCLVFLDGKEISVEDIERIEIYVSGKNI